MDDLPEHVRHNREKWDREAAKWVASGERAWAQPDPAWGIWQIPESEVHLLPKELRGKDAIELGCGTGYVSAWLARRGARVVAIDNSAAQLATARRLQDQHQLHFPLIHGNAESIALPDSSFDFTISEYGACLWADPKLWVPEAARLLRPGGELVFLTNSYVLMLCMPEYDGIVATDRMLRPAFDMYRMEWPDDSGIEFHLSHGDWIKLLRSSGFEIEDLIELRPREESDSQFPFAPYITYEWSRKWPCEEVWKARKR